MKSPLFVAFYTPSYREHKERLEASLNNFSLRYEISEVKDLGSWEKNSLFKAEFLEKYVRASNEEAICYIDADAEVVKRPDLLFNVKSDLAFVFFMAHQKTNRILTPAEYIHALLQYPQFFEGILKKRGKEYATAAEFHIDALELQMASKGALLKEFAPQLQSGLLFLKRNERVLELLKLWKELCKKFPEKLDGNLFQDAVRESSLSISFLPLTYFYISDLIQPITAAPAVVLQHQASRGAR